MKIKKLGNTANVKHPKNVKCQLKITNCTDPLMWYANKVGQTVPFLREEYSYFISREPMGAINIVYKTDAEIMCT